MQGKRIVLGVCGGIAAYKAADLTSKLQQAGALVDVVLTEHAIEFIQPLTFSSLSHRSVHTNLWEPTGEAAALCASAKAPSAAMRMWVRRMPRLRSPANRGAAGRPAYGTDSGSSGRSGR